MDLVAQCRDKAELLQLNRTQFSCLIIFVSKKVGNQKKLRPLLFIISVLKVVYSEVPNRRACSLRFFRFSFHPARNFPCNKQKIPPCSFINLLSKRAGRVEFFPYSARLFRSALLLGTSE